MQKRLAVVLPVYNAMPFLPAAIDSVLAQTYSDFDLIVVNDGSTDGSRAYLDTVVDERLTIIDQSNAGPGAARNTGLSRCDTEYVALMDQDDVSLPERFRSQIAYLDQHPDIIMVGTQIEFLVGDRRQRAHPCPLDHRGIDALLSSGQAGVCHPSLMLRADAARAIGGYPVGVLGEDIDFCLRMCEHGHVANLDRVLFRYRLHMAQTVLSKYKQLCLDNAYAAARARARRAGQPEPGYESFAASRSIWTKWLSPIEAFSLLQYRQGRIDFAAGHSLRGIGRLAVAAACRPGATARHGWTAARAALAPRGRQSAATQEDARD